MIIFIPVNTHACRADNLGPVVASLSCYASALFPFTLFHDILNFKKYLYLYILRNENVKKHTNYRYISYWITVISKFIQDHRWSFYEI